MVERGEDPAVRVPTTDPSVSGRRAAGCRGGARDWDDWTMDGEREVADEEQFVSPIAAVSQALEIPPEWFTEPPNAGVREPRRPILPSAGGTESAEAQR